MKIHNHNLRAFTIFLCYESAQLKVLTLPRHDLDQFEQFFFRFCHMWILYSLPNRCICNWKENYMILSSLIFFGDKVMIISVTRAATTSKITRMWKMKLNFSRLRAAAWWRRCDRKRMWTLDTLDFMPWHIFISPAKK